MKKPFFSAMLMMLLSAALYSQSSENNVKNDLAMIRKDDARLKKQERTEKKELKRIEATDVSYMTMNNFYADFPGARVISKERTPFYDRVSYSLNGQQHAAFYDINSNLIGTITVKTYTDLPVNARNLIDRKYRGYQKAAVLLFDDNEENDADMILYGKVFDDRDSYFIELSKPARRIVLQVTPEGEVSFFGDIKNNQTSY